MATWSRPFGSQAYRRRHLRAYGNRCEHQLQPIAKFSRFLASVTHAGAAVAQAPKLDFTAPAMSCALQANLCFVFNPFPQLSTAALVKECQWPWMECALESNMRQFRYSKRRAGFGAGHVPVTLFGW